ncbi:MAG TPA: MFS transporter [Rhizomicrobium sp.]
MSTTFPAAFATSLVPTIFRKIGLPLADFWVFSLPVIPYWLRWAVGPVVDSYWNDRIGRRKSWMLPCTFGAVGAYCVLALFPPQMATLWIVVAIIFVKSMFTATQEVAIDAYMVDIVREQDRPAAAGVIVTSEAFGQMLALAGLGFVLQHYGWKYAAVSAALLMAALLLPNFIRREPPVPDSIVRTIRTDGRRVWHAFRPLARYFARRDSWALVPIYLVSGLFTGSLIAMLGPFLIDLKFQLSAIGLIIGATLAGSVLLGSIAGYAALKRFGSGRVLVALAIFAIPSVLPAVWMAYTHTRLPIPWTIAVLALPTLMTSIYYVVFGTARIGYASRLQAGTDYATSAAITRIGQTVASGLGGPVAAFFGWHGFFIAVGVLSAVAAGLFYVAHRPIKAMVDQRNVRETTAA